MGDFEQQLLDVFLEESDEILQTLENGLIDLEQNKEDSDLINLVFRNFHTLKGSAGLVGFKDLADYTHHIESTLGKVRDGELSIDSALMNVFLKSLDKVKSYMDRVKSGSTIGSDFFESEDDQLIKTEDEPAKKEAVKEPSTQVLKDSKNEESVEKPQPKVQKIEEVQVQEKSSEDEAEKVEQCYELEIGFHEDILKTGANPVLLIQELFELGKFDSILMNHHEIPDFKEIDFTQFYLKWNILMRSESTLEDVEDVFLFVKDDHPIEIKQIEQKEYLEKLEAVREKETEQMGTIQLKDGLVSERELQESIGRYKPLGEMLVESGYIDQGTLDKALEKQSKAKERERSFIRVNTEKLDTLLNYVSELIITHSRVYSFIHELSAYSDKTMEINNVITSLENLTRDIQEQVMSVRMIPLGPTFVQFNRMVRDLAQAQGKKINLKIVGSETELDKNMIEKISDPLKHMVRNACDHGIETTVQRKKDGKPETGTLLLEAYYREGSVVIKVQDDGKGLSKEKLLQKATEKGIIEEGMHLSDDDIYQLIFHPGFSTADKITDISGRGVGMDVVKQNIESLRGKVEISSVEGEGTTFLIFLPLTMAIIDGMLIKLNDTFYVIPLLSIIESFKPESEILNSVEGNVEVIEFRNDYIPLVRLGDSLYQQGERKRLQDSILIIVESNGKKYGFQADELIGQQQVVVKSLESNYRNVEGLSGATILGDGKVAFILDIEGIVRLSTRKNKLKVKG